MAAPYFTAATPNKVVLHIVFITRHVTVYIFEWNQPTNVLFFFFLGNNQRAIRMASPVPDLDTSLPQTLVPLFGIRRGSDPGNIQKSKKSNICGGSLSIFS